MHTSGDIMKNKIGDITAYIYWKWHHYWRTMTKIKGKKKLSSTSWLSTFSRLYLCTWRNFNAESVKLNKIKCTNVRSRNFLVSLTHTYDDIPSFLTFNINIILISRFCYSQYGKKRIPSNLLFAAIRHKKYVFSACPVFFCLSSSSLLLVSHKSNY